VSLRIGTRRSALALAQARLVAGALGGGELVEIVTAGDRGAPGGDKSRWVAELERALLDGEIDVAVHSAKDVPGELAGGLVIAAVPERADPRDVLVTADPLPDGSAGDAALAGLAPGARVGTSSLRRQAQLRAAREDLEVVPMRGNVDTRLRKLADGEVDALVLAAAGLERLDRLDEAGAFLSCEVFVPAPGQGSLAVQARAGDAAVERAVAAIDHPASHDRLRAERAFSVAIGASCHTPIGAHLGRRGALVAFVGRPDGSHWIRDRLEGEEPQALGRELAERMLAAGAGEILGAA
jgi:hydroxymethylbilane synthase